MKRRDTNVKKMKRRQRVSRAVICEMRDSQPTSISKILIVLSIGQRLRFSFFMGLFLRLDNIMICWEKTTKIWKSQILQTIIPRLVITQAVRAIGWFFSKWIFIFWAQRPWGWTVRNTSLSGVDNLAWSSKKKALSRHNTWDYVWGPSLIHLWCTFLS